LKNAIISSNKSDFLVFSRASSHRMRNSDKIAPVTVKILTSLYLNRVIAIVTARDPAPGTPPWGHHCLKVIAYAWFIAFQLHRIQLLIGQS
jgi:hypothetical protein